MSQSDEDLIRELNAAWDRHDPEGLAEAFTDDAHFITVNGAWTTSRQGFRDLMQRCKAGRARASRLRCMCTFSRPTSVNEW